MKPLLYVFVLLAAGGVAAERTITIRDEHGRDLSGAEIEAILTPPEDPRLASVVIRKGATDSKGRFRYDADENLILSRVRAKRPGHLAADMDHRHGLGRTKQSTELNLTLPRETELISLHYREVRLSGLPTGKRIGFDVEAADAIAPWGKGKVVDFELELESRQVGWTESKETLAELRRTAEGVRMDDQEWAATYGHFRGNLGLFFPRQGDGLIETTAFWPYCLLKMPALAPEEGYVAMKSHPFDTLSANDSSYDATGHYLRVRTQLAADGRISSAHYAKIQGRIQSGHGWVTFRLYYNPRADDRRLAFDVRKNLLRPPPWATPAEQERFQAFEP